MHIWESSELLLVTVQNRILRVLGGYYCYARTERLHFDSEILMLKTYIKPLALELYASARSSRNM